MDTESLQELIGQLLSGDECDVEDLDLMWTESFTDAGVLTHDDGLVVHVGNLEFQVTVVRSR